MNIEQNTIISPNMMNVENLTSKFGNMNIEGGKRSKKRSTKKHNNKKHRKTRRH
jgi:hypothetical protein